MNLTKFAGERTKSYNELGYIHSVVYKSIKLGSCIYIHIKIFLTQAEVL